MISVNADMREVWKRLSENPSKVAGWVVDCGDGAIIYWNPYSAMQGCKE